MHKTTESANASEEVPEGAAGLLTETCSDKSPGNVIQLGYPEASDQQVCPTGIFSEQHWHIAYRNSIKNAHELARHIPLSAEEKVRLKQVAGLYHMRIPLYYLGLIRNPLDPDDPIRKQCIPSVEELHDSGHEHLDPLGEEKNSPTPCLVHRYPDRALLIVTSRCFMYCRHCTRKRLWRTENSVTSLRHIEQSLRYLRANRQIREVIVSGGDPLTMPTERLDYILRSVSAISHIEAIRIGTRAPVVFPQRVDDHLCRTLEKYDRLWINVHFNHPREVTDEAEAACRKLQRCGIPLNNQTVLLRGVNDDPQLMTDLCHRLQRIRVRPYYLFQCDMVVGTAHFRTSVFKGIEIVEHMRGRTSGLCIPMYVVDGVDNKGKVPLQPNYLLSVSDEGVLLRNYESKPFFYYNPRETAAQCSAQK